MSAVVKCNIVELYYHELKVKMFYDSLAYLMSIVSMQPIPTTPLLKSHLFVVTTHGVRWLQLVNVDSNHPTLRQNTHLVTEWKLSNSPWNIRLRYRRPLPEC